VLLALLDKLVLPALKVLLGQPDSPDWLDKPEFLGTQDFPDPPVRVDLPDLLEVSESSVRRDYKDLSEPLESPDQPEW